MSKRMLILAGILTVIVAAVCFFGFRGQDTSAVDREVARLVKEFDNAIYLQGDYKAAKATAQEIVNLADWSSNPNGTKVRGIIRLAYGNIAMGKWDGTWREKVQECEALISDELTVERAELLLYSGHLMSKWGKHEHEAGFKKTEEALRIAKHVNDDRSVALAYIVSTELQMFLGRKDLIAISAYRALSVADSYGEKSIKVLALRNLIMDLVYLEKMAEAANVGERLLQVAPGSTDAFYPMFVMGKSLELEKYVRQLDEKVSNLPVGAPERRVMRARLGEMLTDLGKAYFMREEFSRCCETLEQAIPHLKAVDNSTILKSCLVHLQLGKLGFASDVPSLDKVAKPFQEAIDSAATAGDENITPMTADGTKVTAVFTDFLAEAYAKFGEREKSLKWRGQATAMRANERSNNVDHLRHSADLYWNAELELRKKRKNAAESQLKIWLLSSALVLGLTVCALLGCFYYLLRQKSNSLESVVAARTRSLYRAMQKANAADLAKSDFLAQINHEIRNPLTAILGYCELLSLEKNEPSKFVKGIESSSLHLRELVDKILEVSKIESTGLEAQIAEFFPKQMAIDIRGIVAEQAVKQGLCFESTFKGDPGCLILSDETKIRQIALNLIGNAIKFTEQGSVTASFELRVLTLSAQAELVIVVNDTGIGISEGESEAVFERFTKAGTGATHDGSGLGLFITKRLVECLSGEIRLKSTPGVGTQVRVILPVEISDVSSDTSSLPTTDAIPIPEKLMAYSGKRVLVVDDREMIRISLKLQLEAYSLECKTDWELERTIELVENWLPDLVLLDLRMPKHSGFEVLEKIRSSNHGSVTVYAMTGDATVRAQQQCLSVGFDGFITKPFNINSVLEIFEPEKQAV